MSSTESSARGGWLSLLEHHTRERGTKTAISVRTLDGHFRELSYAGLLERARAYASFFVQHSEPGQVIPLCLARGPEAAAAMLGALIVGRAFCFVNPKLRGPQIEHIVTATGASCAAVDDAGLRALHGGISPRSPLGRAAWLALDEDGLSRRAQRARDELAARARVLTMDDLGKVVLPRLPDSNERVGACLFTSGSTGGPKGVLIGSGDLRARAVAEVAWYGLSASDVLLNLLPFSFDVGLNQLISSITIGAELVVLDSWLPNDIRQTVRERCVTGISAVPTIWADMMRDNVPFDREGAHRALRYVTISGGDMTRAQHARLPELLAGAQIFKTYGQTEAFRATSLRPEEYAAKPGSVGRPFIGVEVYIARDDGTLAAPGELGEVVHGGLGVMLGYLDGHDPQRKLRDNPWRGGAGSHGKVVFTGDLGWLDADGYLFLSGRRDDMVKIHGNRVYPGEVRERIAQEAGVSNVEVVVARTDTSIELAAFVVPERSRKLDASELRRSLLKQLPSYMVPELILLREGLPRTASGKPDRLQLAAQAAQLVSSQSPTG